MKPEEIKRWLRPEEITLYDRVLKALFENEAQLAEIKLNLKYSLDAALIGEAIGILKNHIAALESLARCRMLIREFQKFMQAMMQMGYGNKDMMKKTAAELDGLPRGG